MSDHPTVWVRLLADDPRHAADLRRQTFRHLSRAPRGRRSEERWASDAVAALAYGRGDGIFARPILLPADPRELLVRGELVVGAERFPDEFGAPSLLLGWIARDDAPGALGFAQRAAPRYRGIDWVTGGSAEAAVFSVGRFRIRAVPVGGLLYNGLTRRFDRPSESYSAAHAHIEVYDRRHPHGPLGQFVSSYWACTLAERPTRGRLDLQGDVPEWTMTPEETATTVAIARTLSRT